MEKWLGSSKVGAVPKEAFVKGLMMHQLHHAIQGMGWHGKAWRESGFILYPSYLSPNGSFGDNIQKQGSKGHIISG